MQEESQLLGLCSILNKIRPSLRGCSENLPCSLPPSAEPSYYNGVKGNVSVSALYQLDLTIVVDDHQDNIFLVTTGGVSYSLYAIYWDCVVSVVVHWIYNQ